MGCNGICSKYKCTKPSVESNGRYAEGQKRCSTCEIYIKWDGVKCPCCNITLRHKPRSTAGRKRNQKFNMIERI